MGHLLRSAAQDATQDATDGQGHDHVKDHGHVHEHGSRSVGSRLRHALSEVFGGHSHDSAKQIDDALEASAAGRRALWVSLAILSTTAAVQAVVAHHAETHLLLDVPRLTAALVTPARPLTGWPNADLFGVNPARSRFRPPFTLGDRPGVSG